MRDRIISEIAAGLSGMGLDFTRSGDADFSMDAVFLDASWGTGNQKITYQAKITADGTTGIVYMWEFTREEGGGFSFKAEGESSFQSGKALSRKIKRTQFGSDGKAYEIALDLGAVSKIAKQAAKNSGWKFKTVLKKENAMYRPATVPPPGNPREASAGAPTGTAAPLDNTETPSGASGRLSGILYWIGFIAVGLLAVLIFASSKTSVLGWILGSILLMLLFLLRTKFAAKGWLFNLCLWIAAMVAFIVICVATSDLRAEGNMGSATGGPGITYPADKGAQEEGPFRISQYLVTQIAIDDTDYVKNTSSRYVFAWFTIGLDKELTDGSRGILKSVKVNNFKVVKQETGHIAFYGGMGQSNAFDYRKRQDFIIDKELSAKEVSMEQLMATIGESAFNSGESTSGYCGRLEFTCAIDTEIVSIDQDYDALSPEAILEILKPATISFDVVVENEAGEMFVKSYTQELFTKNQVLNSEVINNMQLEPMYKK